MLVATDSLGPSARSVRACSGKRRTVGCRELDTEDDTARAATVGVGAHSDSIADAQHVARQASRQELRGWAGFDVLHVTLAVGTGGLDRKVDVRIRPSEGRDGALEFHEGGLIECRGAVMGECSSMGRQETRRMPVDAWQATSFAIRVVNSALCLGLKPTGPAREKTLAPEVKCGEKRPAASVEAK